MVGKELPKIVGANLSCEGVLQGTRVSRSQPPIIVPIRHPQEGVDQVIFRRRPTGDPEKIREVVIGGHVIPPRAAVHFFKDGHHGVWVAISAGAT